MNATHPIVQASIGRLPSSGRWTGAIAGTLFLSFAQAAGTGIRDVGDQRQLFLDDFVIENMQGVRLQAHAPRNKGLVLRFDKPWEGAFCGYSTVIRDDDTYRLYYRGLPKGEHDTGWESLCYAESADGIHWTKPNLGNVEVKGVRQNNCILTDSNPGTCSFAPFLDTKTGVPSRERFKALGLQRTPGNQDWCLAGWVSADGKRWQKLREEPVIVNDTDHFAFDSHNVAFWSESEGCYLAYFRTWKNGIRRISRATSDDFLNWSPSRLMEYTRRGERAPIHHLYVNQTHPYFRAPQIYIATAARFMPGRQVITPEQAGKVGVNAGYFRDTSDCVLLTTRGGNTYECNFLGAFIRPGVGLQNWVSRSNYPALNVVPTGPSEMSIYVNRNYAQPTSYLARYSMRLDGFASVQAPYEGGELVTRPLRFAGSRLTINYSTSAAGDIRVEIQDANGKPLPDYSLDDCPEIIGDEIERRVGWKSGDDVGKFAGQPVRLRFVMRDADLFAFKFGE